MQNPESNEATKVSADGHGPNKENAIGYATEAPHHGSAMTPVSRLAWQDLMGVADSENQLKDTSPEERLQWHCEEDHLDARISPIAPRCGKKRARSSSPLSSPAIEKLRKPAVNVQGLKQALKTPHADPALDLWDRFAVGGPDSRNILGATNPALAHLMVSSSPRPSKESSNPMKGESGLRRAMSCGNQWPKRRRVESLADSGAAVPKRGDTTKTSMVTALLETVNGEINKSDEMDQDSFTMESPSYKKQRSPRKPRASAPMDLRQSPAEKVAAANARSVKHQGAKDPETSISDYGDDDFDDSSLWDLDASLLSGQTDTGSFMIADEKDPPQPHVEAPKLDKSIDEDDEFGDMDDDLIAVANLIEVTPTTTVEPAAAPVAKATRFEDRIDESDDIYGDDFGGDFDFEAAELAATQSVGQANPSLLPVRPGR